MVEIDELMLGNYVSYRLEDYHVVAMDSFDEEITLSSSVIVKERDLSPIELTSRWLEDLGFEWYEPLEHWRLILNEEWYEVHKDSGYFWFCFSAIRRDEWWKMPDRKVEYVHQLQNLFYSVSRRKLKLI